MRIILKGKIHSHEIKKEENGTNSGTDWKFEKKVV